MARASIGPVASNDRSTEAANPAKLPLIVDMDSLLLHPALSAEGLLGELESSVARMSRALRGERQNISPEMIAQYARRGVDVSQLPLQGDLVDYLIASVETGREVHLITSAAQEIAEAMATRIGGFVSAMGSTGERAMTNAEKLRVLQARFPDGFAYAGRAPQLLQAASAVVVSKRDRAIAQAVVARGGRIEAEISAPAAGMRTWLKVLHFQQWPQNALMFVPLLVCHAYGDMIAVLACLAGFVLLCALASGAAVVADVLDLEADRQHPVKRNRPLARGDISVGAALLVAVTAIAVSLAGAYLLSVVLCALLAGYLPVRLLYARQSGRFALGDVGLQAVLFTLPLGMGIVAAGVAVSPVLLGFAMFLFVSMALAKRYWEDAQQVRTAGANVVPGDERVAGAALRLWLGLGCHGIAMLALLHALTQPAMPRDLHRQPHWLWVAAFVVLVWTLRIWWLSYRGKIAAGAVGFLFSDKTCLGLGIAVACLVVVAR